MNASDRLKSAIDKLTQMIAKLDTPTVQVAIPNVKVVAIPNVKVVAIPNVPSVFKTPTIVAVPSVFTKPRDPNKFDTP